MSVNSTEILEEYKRLTAAEREARMLGRLTNKGYRVSEDGVTCCICGKVIPTVYTPEGNETGIGRNNPAPLVDTDGRVCCATCNERYVIPARIGQADRIRVFDLTDAVIIPADAATIAEE